MKIASAAIWEVAARQARQGAGRQVGMEVGGGGCRRQVHRKACSRCGISLTGGRRTTTGR